MSSRLSQTQREALERQDARFIAVPLHEGIDKNVTFAHLRHTARLLKDRQAHSPSARAVAYVNALYDRSIPAEATQVLACRQGCAHCCRQPVLVYAPEAFFLAAHIRNRPEIAALIPKAAQDVRGLNPASVKWITCPLLIDNSCSLYAARPLSCHSFVSMDVNDCINAFEDFHVPNVRNPVICNTVRTMCRMILLAAIRALGLPVVAYELNSAVAAVLAQDNLEKRWLRGEDVLAGLENKASPLPPNYDAEITQLAAAIAPML